MSDCCVSSCGLFVIALILFTLALACPMSALAGVETLQQSEISFGRMVFILVCSGLFVIVIAAIMGAFKQR